MSEVLVSCYNMNIFMKNITENKSDIYSENFKLISLSR